MKKIGYIFLFFQLLSWSTIAQSFDQYVIEGRRSEKNLDEENSLKYYFLAYQIRPTEIEPLYKVCELNSRIGNRCKQSESKEKYYQNALDFSKKLVQLHPNNDLSHVAMAMSLGRIALTKSGKEKIVTVKDIKKHADMALKLNPNNFKAWHILGKWHYEVSDLNFIESAAVKLFFGGLPESSFSLAINAYEKAKKIAPEFCLNYLELAKAYYKNDQKSLAISQLKKVIQLPSSTADDIIIKKEAGTLIKSWQ
jgi:tetratricopeptide (TPR) repeat protein